MRSPFFRSPIILAIASLLAGLVVKWALNAEFSIGGTMVVILWVLPLIGLAITSDEYLPGGWDADSDGARFLSSRENRLEVLALLALPGLGFALDMAAFTFSTAALAAVGAVGIGACAQLVRLEQKKR